jgi:hypothetical protein
VSPNHWKFLYLNLALKTLYAQSPLLLHHKIETNKVHKITKEKFQIIKSSNSIGLKKKIFVLTHDLIMLLNIEKIIASYHSHWLSEILTNLLNLITHLIVSSFKITKKMRGVSSHCSLAIYIQNILRQKKNYENSKISPCKNKILKKKL